VFPPSAKGTLITANARLARQLLREDDAARRQEGLRFWESPDVVPREAWLARLWQECVYCDSTNSPLLLNRVQEEALWEQAIAASDAGGVLLDVPATAAAAARAWDLLHSWEAVHDPAEFAGLPDPAAFSGWMKAVERELRERDWITTSQLPRALCERVLAGTLKIANPMAAVGFDELTPADRRLFAACAVAERPAAEPFFPALRERRGFDNTQDELVQAAVWARRKLEAAPGARIGIVVRGLAAQAAAVDRIFDDVLHPGLEFARPHTRSAFHVSAGVPSSDAPPIAAALLALGLKSGLGLPEAGMLLRSPFLGLDRGVGARLDADLRRQGVEEVSLRVDLVRRAFPDFAAAAEQARARQRPGEWSAVFSKLLTAIGWPGERPLSPAEYQTLEHWKKLLSELASLDLVMPRVPYETALTRLRRIAREHRFAPSDEDAPIQVMDVLEAAGSRFDAVWIAGLHAGVWPQAPRPHSFLPLALQRTAGMPHSSPER
jgi:ATP-dependent helicase/nuclease subunit B